MGIEWIIKKPSPTQSKQNSQWKMQQTNQSDNTVSTKLTKTETFQSYHSQEGHC